MDDDADLAKWTAGLSLHALMQLLRGAAYETDGIVPMDVVTAMVEAYIKSQLGDDVVEFKTPSHGFDAIVGCARLKAYLEKEVQPRCATLGKSAISSILVPGPIGGGKTFIMEALAASLRMPVMELKNIRSQWFGQTDVIIDRLRRVLASLSRVCIFIDEADSQFGDISKEEHSTEKRVSGAILRLMSDPRFKGRILWLLMTARPHLLPPDMKREGRGGNLIIPILDPATDEDKREFLAWVLKPVLAGGAEQDALVQQFLDSERLKSRLATYSAASYELLRKELAARQEMLARPLETNEVIAVIEDIVPPDIALTRRYQTLQALMNCTRRSLLPAFEGELETQREQWAKEIRELELRGAR
jgi:SpoVK/Ycf46/Vps4 family AAA+-type ATPase